MSWIETEWGADMSLKIIIIETTPEKTQLTLDSLMSSTEYSEESPLEEIDYEIPIETIDTNHLETPIYIIPKTDTFKKSWKTVVSIESLEDSQMIFMFGGFFSIPYKQLLKLTVRKPTIFKSLPMSLNFFSENTFMIPSKIYHGQLIDLAIRGEIDVNDTVIGIDKNHFMRFFENSALSPIRTALSLNTPLEYCQWSFDKLTQLSRAKASITRKFRDLSKSLPTRNTKDKVIRNYIRLLESFENGCSKEDYVFYCMMNFPNEYLKAVSMKPFLENLMEVNPNEITLKNGCKKTIYDILVEYTLSEHSPKEYTLSGH